MANVSKATFIDQGIEFPLWATEETLQAVRTSLDKDYRADRSESRTQTQAQIKTTKAITTASTKSTEYYLRLLRTFGKMDGSFKNLSEAILASGVKGTTGQVIATSLGALDNYVKIVRQLSDVGAGLNTRYIELVNSSAEAFMFINEFASTVSENGVAIRNLGSSATEGFIQFAKLSRQLQESTRSMGMFAMQQEELNDLLLNQIEIERLSGATGADVTERTATAMEDLVRETTGMAEITGRSRREALRAAQDTGTRADTATYIRGLRNEQGDEAADRQQAMFQQLGAKMQQAFGTEMGARLTDDVLKMFLNKTMNFSDTLLQLAPVMGSGAWEDLSKALGSGSIDRLQESINAVGQGAKDVAKNIGMDSQYLIQTSPAHKILADMAMDTRIVKVATLDDVKRRQKLEMDAQGAKRRMLVTENVTRQFLSDVKGAQSIATIVVAETIAEFAEKFDVYTDGLLTRLAEAGYEIPSDARRAFKDWAAGTGPADSTLTQAAIANARMTPAQKREQAGIHANEFSGGMTPGSNAGMGDDMWTGIVTDINKRFSEITTGLNSIVEAIKRVAPALGDLID